MALPNITQTYGEMRMGDNNNVFQGIVNNIAQAQIINDPSQSALKRIC